MRIASLQPSITLTLASLGRLNLLCACTKYCIEVLPELAVHNLSVLHDSWTADTEEIRAARPDLVVASVPYRMESLAAILKAGLPMLAFAPRGLDDIYKDICLLAALVDARQAGEAIILGMQERLAAVRSQCVSASSRTVYCEEWGKPMIHSQLWVRELVETAGGRCIGIPGAHTTLEEVAAADPDVMLFAWCGAGDRVPLKRVVAQRGWEKLRAVRNGDVYCIPDEFLNTPAPTLMEGLACIASAVHPKLFPLHSRLIRLDNLSQR